MTEPTPSLSGSNRLFDEFSPKELILRVQRAGKYVLSKWKIVLLFAFLCGLLGATNSFLKKPAYQAEITFALDEGAVQSATSEYAPLSEQLGMGKKLEAGGVFSSITNIVELLQSRLLIEKTLRQRVQVEGHPLVFADFFLDSLDYRNKWMKNSPYKLNFLSRNKGKEEQRFENGIIRNIYETLVNQQIKINSKGKGTTIISVTCTSPNELFSKYFLEELMEEVTRYYIEIKTKRAKIYLDFVQNRTDSIRNAFSSSLYGRASYADSHLNPILRVTSVPDEKHQTDVQVLRTTYIELVKNLESAKTMLMRETPLIQYIDVPILPLKVATPGILRSFILFFLAGAFFFSLLLVLFKTYRYLLSQ